MRCLSFHRVSYNPEASCFTAEVQFVSMQGVQRKICQWRRPVSAGFDQISRGLRAQALQII